MRTELIELDRAREMVLERVGTLGAEPVPLGRAWERVLATAVEAREDVPGFDNSSMDGFAVRSSDVGAASGERPVRLRVIDESRAGLPAQAAVGEGEAIAISTGAMLPRGADAVVRVEDTSTARAGVVQIHASCAAGENVRGVGEDLRAGETVLEAGVLLGPAELGLLSAAAAPRPVCRRRPSVAVLTTGDELHGPDGALAVGGVRDTSIYALPALVRQAGAECVEASTIGDAADVVTGELRRLLATADVLIVCGGVSVGEHDHVRPALARLGVEEIFWGIALKPGRPTWFGAGEGRRVFGLPGNPVSAIVTFLLLVRPALLAMGGRGSTGGRVSATLTEPVARNRNRTQAVRVRISEGPESRLATPTGPQGSHVLSSMLGAGGLAIIGAGEGEVKAGERIEVELLPGAG